MYLGSSGISTTSSSSVVIAVKSSRVRIFCSCLTRISVYEDPINLFVATFLGTPPINVFDAEVKDSKLLIGGEAVMEVPGVAEGKVTTAIRPEAFDPAADGKMTCRLRRIEVMGRDISVVLDHDCFVGEAFRAIVDSNVLGLLSGTEVKFNLEKKKVYLFHPETGERIRF